MSNGVETTSPAVCLVEPPQTAESMSRGLSRRLGLIIVLALTFLVYADTTRYQFTYDDRAQIVENPALRSWSYAPRCFTEHVWQVQYPDQRRLYRPLFTLYLLVNYQLFRLNPAGWHLLMIIWHTLVTLLVFMLARRLLGDDTTSLVVALLYGLHPAHIEAVAWISGVTEPMLAIFFLGSLLAYLRWRDSDAAPGSNTGEEAGAKTAKWLGLSWGLYTLALLSKETALVMPALIFACEWLFGARAGRIPRAFKRALPFLALGLVYFVVRTIVLKSFTYVCWNLPLSVTLMTLPSVLWFYIRLLVWPVGLSGFYDTPYTTSPDATFRLTSLALVAVAVGLAVWAKRSKPIAFAALLLILPIIPLLNLPGMIEKEIAHDRYLYIPSIGFAIMLAMLIRRLPADRLKTAGLPAAQALATLVVALAFAALTVTQNTFWANDLHLFARGVETAPGNDIGLTNLANELFNEQRVDEAMPLYQAVTDRNPTYWRAFFNLGSCYFIKGDNETALKYRARAKEMKTLMDDDAGRTALVHMRLGRLAEAEAMFARARRERPDVPQYDYGLGIVRKEKGDLEGALAAFKAAAVGNPDPLPAETQVAEIEARLGRAASRVADNVK
jgi:protein O-mannosyl-transferase